jgi:hypothetical protein
MKRVDIKYDGTEYSIGNRDAEDVRAEIDAKLASPEAGWLAVNSGEGRLQPAQLLITPGIAFALIDIDDSQPDKPLGLEDAVA